jgi:hydrogenase/urease accessory protein HupE
MVPAIVRSPLSIGLELPWAFIVVYLMGLILGLIEIETITISFKRTTIVVLLILIGLSLIFFTAFTFEKPWIDVFTAPTE